MNERQLKSFIIAADMKSLSKGAAASYISTPAFVQQINLLEDSLGFKLLNRGRRGITLTPSGEVFYKAAVEILSIYEGARQQCLELEKTGQHTLKIACPPEQLPMFVMQSCRQFQENHPQTSLSFVPSSLRQHLSDLNRGRVDLAFMAEPAPDHLDGLFFCPLCEDTFSFCMHPNHPLAGKTLLTAEDILPYPIICGKYEFLRLAFEDALPKGATISLLQDEYDASARMRSHMSEELIIIHSHWSNCYSNTLKVIPSNISAGKIGVVLQNPGASIFQQFICNLQDYIDGAKSQTHRFEKRGQIADRF